jgi:cytochrome b involved in lipid metabolism
MFKNDDYNKLIINKNTIKSHKSNDNAWIIINHNVYSLHKNDIELLNTFKNYYGTDATKYMKNTFNNNEKIFIMKKLETRIIGYIS